MRKAALLAASLVLSLAAMEWTLRDFASWAPRADLRMYELREGLVVLKPGFRGRHKTPLWDVQIAINERGWRDEVERAPDTVLLGDSFVFGWGVEQAESFHTLWERAGGQRILAAGVPGAGPCEYARYLEALGRRYRPRRIVVAFYAGNDFADAEPGCPQRFAVQDGLLTPVDAPGGRVRGWLRRSQILQSLRAASFALSGEQDRVWDGALRRLGQIHLRHPPSEVAQNVAVALAQLEGVRGWCMVNGARMTLLVIPRRAQIVEAEQAEWQEALGVEAGELDWLRPQEILREWAVENGVEIVDPLESMRNLAAAGRELYHHPDAHLNRAGHAAVAAALAASSD